MINKIKNIISSSGLLLIATVVTTVSGFFTTLIILRNMGVTNVGYIGLAQSIMFVVVALLNPQTWQSVIYFKHDDVKLYRGIDLYLGICGTLLILIISILTFFLFDDIKITLTILAISPSAFSWQVGTIIGIYRRDALHKKYMLVMTTVAIFKIVIIFIFLNSLNIKSVFFIVIIISLGDFLMYLLLCINLKIPLIEFSRWSNIFEMLKADSSRRLKFLKWNWISSISDMPVKEGDMLLVALVSGVHLAGTYKIFKQISTFLNKFTDPIYQVIFPIQVKHVKNGNKKMASSIFIILFFGILIFGIITLLTVKPYFHMLNTKIFGDDFSGYSKILFVFLFIKLISMSTVGLHSLLIAEEKNRLNANIALISNIIFVVCLTSFVYFQGIIGVCIAFAIQTVSITILKIYYIWIRNERLC